MRDVGAEFAFDPLNGVRCNTVFFRKRNSGVQRPMARSAARVRFDADFMRQQIPRCAEGRRNLPLVVFAIKGEYLQKPELSLDAIRCAGHALPRQSGGDDAVCRRRTRMVGLGHSPQILPHATGFGRRNPQRHGGLRGVEFQ